MKTAVSIPDDVFKEAEALARRRKVSRSRLYADALREFVTRHDPDAISESWTRAVEEAGYDELDEAWLAMAAQTLAQVERKE